jgi:hypothetical protein
VPNRATRYIGNAIEEYRLGIVTGGVVAADRLGALHYSTLSYAATRKILARLRLEAHDTFADIGAGKGRAVCLAARCGIAKAIAIEIDPVLAAMAQNNFERLRGRKSPIEIHTQSAEQCDYSDVTAAYLFNPFEPYVLDKVIGKIAADRKGRPFRLAYIMDSEAQRAILEKHGFHCYERWIDDEAHPIALYRSQHSDRPPGAVET